MRYEICKTANGYAVIPVDYHNHGMLNFDKIWVFTTYQALCDKLPEILALTESK